MIAKCFAFVDQDEWRHLTAPSAWSDFLSGARRMLQEDRPLGDACTLRDDARSRCPLQDFVSNDEVCALFAPPTYREKQEFAARHFVGGLPSSALPVESLYSKDIACAVGKSFASERGAYLGSSALYMQELIKRLGLSVPPEYAASPDHLSLELDLTAVMLRSGMTQEANEFFCERVEWLTRFRRRLIALGDEASFYVALVDVLIGIRAQQVQADS